jgi:hypothetical protein
MGRADLARGRTVTGISTTLAATPPPDGLDLVPIRKLMLGPVDVWFRLMPGDRPFVAEGESVVAGTPLAERLRDPRTDIVSGPGRHAGQVQPGDHWSPPPAGRTSEATREGELLFRSGGRWRLASAESAEPLEAPFAGVVEEVRTGSGLRLRTSARALLGTETMAGPSSGRLEVLIGRDGEVRAPDIDVSGAGAILVAGARIDAEALLRARAVGVRGIVVATLGVKERREILASEQRGRAAVHGMPPFAILVLDGAVRRPISSPVMDILAALAGRTVAIVGDPPCLVVDDPEVVLPTPVPGLVRIRSGPLVGAEGAWAGLGGARRFADGVILETGLVRFGDRSPVAVPLGDLERFA